MDEIVQPKERCQYCGKEIEQGKSRPAHERFCSANPNNVRTKKPKPEETIQKKDDQPEHEQIIISHVQAYINPACINEEDLVAWFMGEDGIRYTRTANYQGITTSELGDIPHVLVLSPDGALVPPSYLPGFLGMFSRFHEFTEAKEKAEVPERNLADEIPDTILEEERKTIIIPPQNHAPPEKKKSILAGIFGKKEQKKEKASDDTKEMLREIANGAT